MIVLIFDINVVCFVMENDFRVKFIKLNFFNKLIILFLLIIFCYEVNFLLINIFFDWFDI